MAPNDSTQPTRTPEQIEADLAAARLRLSVDRLAVRDLAAEVEWAKVTLLTPNEYQAAAVKAGRGEPGGFDLPTVMGITVFATIAVIICNLIVDLLYAVIDPRIRLN